jgi:hypothetical protein
MPANGLQYNQWRKAGDITVNRYKTLRGADAFKLPLRPTLVILLVELNPYGIAPFKNNTNLSSRKPL